MNTQEALRVTLDALIYHQEQTRPIQRTIDAIAAARVVLASTRASGWHQDITPLDWRPEDPKALACSCCGGPPSLWEVDRAGTITKMVNCDRAELRSYEEGAPLIESCPMYSPTLAFNKATRREAVSYWNMVQERLTELRASPMHEPRKPLALDFIDNHIGADEGDREAVLAIVREVEKAHGIGI